MVDYIAMGRRVKQFREKKGFTQAELAFAVGKSNITISHIECGSGKPELNTVVTIANALKICVKTIPNLRMREAVETAFKRVSQDGYDVYAAFESTKFFHTSISVVLATGISIVFGSS